MYIYIYTVNSKKVDLRKIISINIERARDDGHLLNCSRSQVFK